jgi:hypothetical protein
MYSAGIASDNSCHSSNEDFFENVLKCSLSCCNVCSFHVKYLQKPEIDIQQKPGIHYLRPVKNDLGVRIRRVQCPSPFLLSVVSCALDRQEKGQ